MMYSKILSVMSWLIVDVNQQEGNFYNYLPNKLDIN